MRVFTWNAPIRGLIFDMDNTLYTNPGYARHQEEVLVKRLAQAKDWSEAMAQKQVGLVRTEYALAHSGHKPSLGNVFAALGIPITTSVEWRKQLLRPENFLQANPQLVQTMHSLAKQFRLAIVTNNPVEIAQRTLAVLGIRECIPVIIGLDSTNLSKPDPAAFRLAATSLDCEPPNLISIGDRYEVDIEPALGLGMGGILVEGVEEVCGLPDFLRQEGKM